jgi:hypothetical protein
MGIQDSRLKYNFDENTIDAAEKGLGIHKLNAKVMVEKLKGFSNNGFVNRNKLVYLAQKYSIHIDNYENHIKITDMFNSLGRDNNQSNYLLLIVILLGRGNPNTKTKLLFKMFDPELQGILSEEQVDKMFRMIYWASAEKLPELVSESKVDEGDLQRHEDYLLKLSSSRCLAHEDFMKRIMKNSHEIDKATFVERFTSVNKGDLSNSIGFRLYLKSFEGKATANRYRNPFESKLAPKII